MMITNFKLFENMKIFTFKTIKPTGLSAIVDPDFHYIKLNKCEIGSIDDKKPFTIRLMVIKEDITEDGNPNCPWKWIRLKKKSETLQEAKDFLNANVDEILKRWNLYMIKNNK